MKTPVLAAAGAATFLAAAAVGHIATRSNYAPTSPAAQPPSIEPAARAPTESGASTPATLIASLSAAVGSAEFARLFLHSGHDPRLRELVILRWADVDPQTALDFLATHPDIGGDTRYWSRLFETWGASYPQDAFAHCATGSDPNLQEAALFAALKGALTNDPDRAFALFAATAPTLTPSNGYSIIPGWLSEDAERNFELIAKHAPTLRWSFWARRHILRNWGRSDASAASAWAKAHIETLTNEEMCELAQGMAESDPAAAARVIESLPPAERSADVAGIVASRLAETDPAAAIVWIDENMRALPKQEALGSMLQSWAQKDPAAAAPFVEALGAENPNVHNVIGHLIRTWSGQSLEDTRNWVTSLPPGTLNHLATQEWAGQWFSRDREAVNRYIEDATPGEIDRAFLLGVAQGGFGWGDVETLDEKVAWVNSLPHQYAVQVAGAVAGYLSNVNPTEAANAAASLATPELQRIGAAAVVRNATHQKPEILGTWIAQQTDPAVRDVFFRALEEPSLDPEKVAIVLKHASAPSAP